jgi:hypothetical protein
MKYVISNSGIINGFFNGSPFTVIPDTENYEEIKNGLINNLDVSNLLLNDKSINLNTSGILSYKYRVPMWDGMPLPTYLSDKVMNLVSRGYSFDPIIKFMYNLCQNPQDHSIIELIDFLRNKNLPLTEDGCFLGYKAIKNDYMDIYTGTIDNHVGQNPKKERKDVDANRDKHCSNGLHVGAIDYVNIYSVNVKNPRFIVAKVNPLNVITVPKDHSFQKLRCCEYNVVAEFNKGFILDDSKIYNEDILTKEISSNRLKIERSDLKPGWKNFIKDRFSKIIDYIKGK